MTNRALVLIVSGCLIVSCTKHEKTETANRSIEVQGHRGARTVLPENTLPAFQYAMQVGVDTLELDMGVTKDNVVVVYHDQKINTTLCQNMDQTQITGDIWLRDLTIAELRNIDCGSKPNPKFEKQKQVPGTWIPTLDQVFQMVKNSKLPNSKNIFFNIETKSNPKFPKAQPNPALFARLVLDVVKKYGFEDRVTIQSFDHRTLLEVKKQAPNIKLAALFFEKPNDWIEATQLAKSDIVSPYFKLITKEDVQKIQAAGLKVIPWTANTENEWQKLIDLGVDGIITDDPKPLLKKLGRL